MPIRRRIFSHITWPKKRRNLLVFQRKTPRPTVNTRADFRIEFGAAVESLLNAVSNVQGVLLCHPVARIIWRYSSRCSYAGLDFRQYSINEFGEQPAHAPVGIARAAICGLAGFAASYAHSLAIPSVLYAGSFPYPVARGHFRSEVQCAQRVAFIGIADRQCGQSLVVGAGAGFFIAFIWRMSKKSANATIKKFRIVLKKIP